MSRAAAAQIWELTGVLAEVAPRVAGHARETPLLGPRALALHDLVPASLADRLHFKNEAAQETGSFKFRGALAKLSGLPSGAEVVSASAGNHGLGVAEAGRRLGVRVRVFVPAHTPAVKREGIEARGAAPVVHSGGYAATERAARRYATETGATFVSPFDDPEVALGNGGTLALEVRAQLGRWPGAFLLPVGGGGLAVGVASAAADSSDPAGQGARVFGVQSEASPAMARSLAGGEAILECPAPEGTLAEGLEGGVSESSFAHARRLGLEVSTVREDEIRRALDAAATRGLWLEGSAAVVLAALMRWQTEGVPAAIEETVGPLVVVLSGGNRDR